MLTTCKILCRFHSSRQVHLRCIVWKPGRQPANPFGRTMTWSCQQNHARLQQKVIRSCVTAGAISLWRQKNTFPILHAVGSLLARLLLLVSFVVHSNAISLSVGHVHVTYVNANRCICICIINA